MRSSCVSSVVARLCGGSTRRELIAGFGAAGAALALGPAAGLAQGSDAATPTRVDATASLASYAGYLLPTSDAAPGNGTVAVTFLGTTSLLFDDGETQLLIDGFLSRPSLDAVLTAEVETDPGMVDAALARAGADRVAALFVAHSHWDHAFDAAYVAQRTGAQLFGSESTLNIGRGGALPEEQMTLYAPGEPLTFGRFTVTILSSMHSPPVPGVNDDIGLVIAEPLRQPAMITEYIEGGSFDMLIELGANAILVKPSAYFIEGALDDVRADVLFLATATLGNQTPEFRHAFYDQTVGMVKPELVVPIHWDDFFQPLSEDLAPLDLADLTTGFDFLIERLDADGIGFGIMQGFDRILLFGA